MEPVETAPGTARGDERDDDRRRAGLVRARRRATGLLVAVAAVFVATLVVGEPVASSTWLGFVQATAEAAMVGGLADWFAVVALFRHPLGLPIPHTAVIPQSKEGLGANLATFVADNFLDPDDLAARLTDADLAGRAGRWLDDADNRAAATDRLLDVLVTVVDDVDADRVATGIASSAVGLLETVPVGDLAGRGLEAAIADGHHADLFTAAVLGIRRAVVDNEQVLRRRLYEESPRWVPPALDDLVYDRAVAGLMRFLDEMATDTDHAVRSIVDDRLGQLARRLQEDPALQERLRRSLADLADNDVVRAWAAETVDRIAVMVHEAAAGRSAPLWSALEARLADLARRLQDDPRLRNSVDDWIRSAAPTVARASRHEISDLVVATVDRWDADETSDRLELWLGRDLQWVRINGTIVGGLVGLVLHALTLL